jgi:hypothetical protein
MQHDRFDRLAVRLASGASRRGTLLLWAQLVCIGPLVALARALPIQPGPPLASEEACFQAGGYVVEVQSWPIVDLCCFCQDAKGGFCKDAAPKAVYGSGDPTGSGPAQDVACLRAGDASATGCTAKCRPMPPRRSAPERWLSR